MEFDIWRWCAALTPIVVLLILLVGFRWGGDEAASCGLLTAIATGAFFFGAGWDMLATAAAKGMWNAISIIIVVFPALAIYQVSRESGGFAAIRYGMEQFSPDKVLQILAVGWIFVGFLQGITGFGVPVAVGAPLLVGLGVRPFTAVLITLLGQAWGNTFGTLGLAWDGLMAQADLSDPFVWRNTVLWTASMLGIANIGAGFIITYLAGGLKGVKRNGVTVLALGLLQGGGQLWIALLNPMLSNFIVTALALGLMFIIGKLPYYQRSAEDSGPVRKTEPNSRENRMSMQQAFLPYVFLTVIALVVLLLGDVKDYLGQWKIALPFAGKTTALGIGTASYSKYSPLAPLIHSGAFLLVSAAAGYYWYYKKGYISEGGWRRILNNSFLQTIPSAIAVLGLLAMAKIMDDTGQTAVLAQGGAAAAGPLYPVLAPFVGLIGTFMTSSNLSSNILFGGFQYKVAAILKVDTAAILAAQTVGGAIGSIIAPSKVLLGTTMVGILGEEGEVIRRFLFVAMLACLMAGLAIFLI